MDSLTYLLLQIHCGGTDWHSITCCQHLARLHVVEHFLQLTFGLRISLLSRQAFSHVTFGSWSWEAKLNGRSCHVVDSEVLHELAQEGLSALSHCVCVCVYTLHCGEIISWYHHCKDILISTSQGCEELRLGSMLIGPRLLVSDGYGAREYQQ